MKIRLKLLMSFSILILCILLIQTKVQAKSYYIDDMKIQVTVLENGDLEVEQTLKYTFNGSFNGIYITIPIKYKNQEEVISEISDSIYNAEGVELQSVGVEKNNEITEFKKVKSATNGQSGVFTEEINSNMYQLKIFSPSDNISKIFKVNYILKNV